MVSTIAWCDVGHIDGGERVLRVFAGFVYLIRVFSGLLPGGPKPNASVFEAHAN